MGVYVVWSIVIHDLLHVILTFVVRWYVLDSSISGWFAHSTKVDVSTWIYR